MLIQIALVFLLTNLLPLVSAFFHVRRRHFVLAFLFSLGTLGMIAWLRGYFPYEWVKLAFALATLGMGEAALYSALKVRTLPDWQRFYLNGIIAPGNIFLAFLYWADFYNLKFASFSDDTVGSVLGGISALISIGMVYRAKRISSATGTSS